MNKHFSHLTPICVKELTGYHTSFVMHFKTYICVNFILLTKGMKSIPPNHDFWTRITSLFWYQISPVILCMQYSVISTRITCLFGSQPSSVFFCIQNSVIWCGIISLYWSQTSPVDLRMQNIVHSIRITILYGSQPSPVAFACKTVTFGPEQQVSMGPRPRQSFCACKKRA